MGIPTNAMTQVILSSIGSDDFNQIIDVMGRLVAKDGNLDIPWLHDAFVNATERGTYAQFEAFVNAFYYFNGLVDAVESVTGNTPIHVAAEHGLSERVSRLLRARADPNVKGFEGRAPLHYAVLVGSVDVIGVLIAAGAELDARDDEGDTPLHLAAFRGDAAVVRTLLDAGADRNAVNRDGRTPDALVHGDELRHLLSTKRPRLD